MSDYPSNSKLAKTSAEPRQEEKVLNKVNLSGGVQKHKKTAAQKIAGVFIQDDIENVKEYVVTDVIVPTIKDTILNIISMFFYGETRTRSSFGSRPLGSSSKVTYKPYASYFDDKYGSSARSSRTSQLGFEYDNLEFETRGDAELVLNEMDAALERYHTLSVFEMYDIAGEVAPFTYQNYGWTSLRGARVVQVPGGRYIIDMPKALPMERQR